MSPQFSWLRAVARLGGLVIALCGSGCGHPTDHAESEAESSAAAVIVQTAIAESRSIDEAVSGIGRSEALPNLLATLTPAVAGHVHGISANLGAAVHAGELIVELDDTVAKADLAEKEAQRDTLQAALDLLKAEPRPADRRGLEIAVEQFKAAVGRAQAGIERLRPLRARKELSEAQLYEAEQALVQAQLQQEAAEAQLALLLAGPRTEAVAEATARLAAAEEAVGLSRAHLNLHKILSPIDGVLDGLTCHPGQTLAAGTPIGEVVDTRQLNVVLWVPAQSAARIKMGQPATVKFGEATRHTHASSAGDELKDTVTRGEVVSVGRIVDPQSGNLPVRVLLDNAAGQIAIGQIVAVSIVVQQHAAELVVPSIAVVDLGEGPCVTVVREGKTVLCHPTSISSHGLWSAIEGTDLQPGEQVVIEGGFNLPEETPVETRPVGQPSIAETQR